MTTSILLLSVLLLLVAFAWPAVNGIATAIRNTCANGYVDAIDVGTTNAGGQMQFHTAGQAALVVALTLNAPAFGAASTGVCTADLIGGITATVGGSGGTVGADGGRIVDRDNTQCWRFSCGTTSADANLTNLVLAPGDTLTLTSFTFTYPAG